MVPAASPTLPHSLLIQKFPMKPSSETCILLLFLLCFRKPTFASIHQKLSEFHSRLQKTVLRPPFPSLDGLQRGRVFYPIEYGADPTGVNDSSDAILGALGAAFSIQNGLEMLPGIKDLGGAVVDLQGGNYKISKPIRFPAGGGANLVVCGGTLRASDTFPGDQHLIELWSPNSQKRPTPSINTLDFSDSKAQNLRIYYEDITFRDILFDSSFRGGGLFLTDTARVRITDCFFLHFTTQGILVHSGHETFISTSFIGQHSTVGGDIRERDFSGTAIELASNDNAVTDVAIFSAAIGVVISGQANIITGVHCYNKATFFEGVGILVKAGASLTRISNCYLDFNAIVMEDPSQVHVTNGFFLGDGNVVLKSVQGYVRGLNIVDNMFSGDPSKMKAIVELEGEFSDINQVVVDRNNAVGMQLKSTVGRLTVGGNGSHWVADFSPLLLFPNRINHFQYSVYCEGGGPGFAAHSVTNISNNMLVVETQNPIQGLVSIVVEQ